MTSNTRSGDPSRKSARLASELEALRNSVGAEISDLVKESEGSPSDGTFRNIEAGKNATVTSVTAYVGACERIARAKNLDLGGRRFDTGYWLHLRKYGDTTPVFADWVADQKATARGPEVGGGRFEHAHPLGQLLEQVSDPFGAGVDVHRSITVGTGRDVDPLPPYVRRDHDDDLAKLVEAGQGGRSGMAVLVADSSAGKTRALWEALTLLRRDGGWRWWHPDESAAPDAVQALQRVATHTVVWLNETQNYLGANVSGAPQELAWALRKLVDDPTRAPVLVLGTLWRGHHDILCLDHTSPVAKLLETTTIGLPEKFEGEALAAMHAVEDPRLREACDRAEDGRITQYLAGGPELIRRYEHATPATRAVIEVAMDGRRMGHRNVLPHMLLRDAAAAYMSRDVWNGLPDNWFELVLVDTSRYCKGSPGPITLISDHPLPTRTEPRTRHTTDRRGTPRPDSPVYRLADYLDQHGRRDRTDTIPPIVFWEAAATHAHPDDQHALAQAAWARGLYRDAAQLWKNAAMHGHTTAARELVIRLHEMFPVDQRPATHAAAHIILDNPDAVAGLLNALYEVGAHDQVQALAARDPAAHVVLDNPIAVARLLEALHEVGAHDQVEALAARDPAAHVVLDNPNAVARLLEALHEVGAHNQTDALSDRLPGSGLFALFRRSHPGRAQQFRFGREPDGTRAPQWTWDDLERDQES
ncbi:hypothetical protein [Nocardia salmonicida]|uniref:hypothetical protein n=1 Tax=Nocardia salmonicida TaxID=53431 RepID=UPI00363294AC